ncbi:hypothetical protein C8N24_0746 [Solirubrobacter pauli]|uniref:Uncharacterized protein n=1 Tax=Solirubrobacter pauli TaxID=166793 RepID=A0A660LDW3_9ACTN|nr:hypothetical protein [Solirubrobacter pauli]RKQ90931.1 hypothetical protein C8N24_0746 [Solirubrobacter pauli]
MGVPINPYPNGWRCDQRRAIDKSGGSGTTGRRWHKDDDGTFLHEVTLRRTKTGHAKPTGLFIRDWIAGKQKTMVLEDASGRELARTEGLPVVEPWKPQWSDVAYRMLKQTGNA